MSANDGVVKQLVLLSGDGNVGKHFNIVIVAEGYRDRDLGTFAADADDALTQLTTVEPFKSNIQAFNVFRLDVASNEAGADQGSTKVATYFDAHFAVQPPQLLLVDADLVATTVSQQLNGPDNPTPAAVHKMIVLVNTASPGGAGGVGDGIAVASRAESARTMLHELGHAFTLTDEYATENPEVVLDSKFKPGALSGPLAAGDGAAAPFWPNLSITDDVSQLPPQWAQMIKPGTPIPTVRKQGDPALPPSTVGCFVDPASSYYRPQWTCKMRDPEEKEFCAVCALYIATQIQNSAT